MKKQKNNNIVYSTNPNFEYNQDDSDENDDFGSSKQHLKIYPDKKNRGGKLVTIISGYKGNKDSLKSLEKELKSLCGCGGSSKNGEILLQGNVIEKVKKHLTKKGYQCKVSGV